MGDGMCKGNMNKTGIQTRRMGMGNDQRHKEQENTTTTSQQGTA
jgi:hypothetical protein